MPTTYAHYTFGKKVLSRLPEEVGVRIRKHRGLFDTGVHGPDIFFYYEILTRNEVRDYGSKMHYEPAEVFFTRAKEVYQKHDEKEAMLAYMMGFLAHFALDSTAHGYVERKEEVSHVSHNKIEAEFDAYLMRKDGYQATKVRRSSSLRPTEFNANIISYFFPFDTKTVHKALKGQVWVLDLFHSPITLKRTFLLKLMTLLRFGSSRDLFLYDEDDERCLDSDLRLEKLYKKAITLYDELAKNFLAFLNDEEELSEYFRHDFEKWDDYKDIPILSYEEEKGYRV